MLYACVVGGLTLWLGFMLGFLLGVRAANHSWLLTGRQDGRYGRTPHHCAGEFFYVIPEAAFAREYVHRVDVAPADRAAAD